MTHTIKAVCFDFGGVIELYPPGNIFRFIAELFNISEDDYKQEYYKHNHLTNVGNQKLEDVFIKTAFTFNINKETADKARSIIQDRITNKRLNTELLSWFPRLKQQGFSVGILSNAPASVKEQWEAKGIYDMVDTVVISGETGFQKPDKEAFAVLFKQLGVLPHETIFIDDTEKSLEKANEIGYHPILFTDNKQLKKELQNFGIEL
ncbi:MAG: HAD-IA family hydrolase [Candidatus Magasanikbacteria bacterium]|nr:HAD-IA family hydrolase [Candidatus Magasanikbacteria bacterium]